MTNIPASIMKAAEEALDNLLCNCVESCGGYDGLRKASIEDIASAILSERTRCAMIARNWQPSTNQDEHYAANSIADKIMAGEA
jgi:hypothetical protein